MNKRGENNIIFKQNEGIRGGGKKECCPFEFGDTHHRDKEEKSENREEAYEYGGRRKGDDGKERFAAQNEKIEDFSRTGMTERIIDFVVNRVLKVKTRS